MRNGSVGDELDVVEQDKQVLTAAEDNSRRRTLLLFKQVDGWGFSLQVRTPIDINWDITPSLI